MFKIIAINIYKTLTSVPSRRQGGGMAKQQKISKNKAEGDGLPLKNLQDV